ncbi:unnamed protein product [Cuscuta epithymum]|uniref:SWIM-type domain-containing protein n=1 Tax=Cuscuta epithymum TaxID=186058 RepID=A0AAV0GEV9_9ASTE|nr:unnamed protein product [Cuscuta epithymum]
MSSEGNIVVMVHWNGSTSQKDDEIEYFIPPRAVLFISEEDDYTTIHENVLNHVRGDRFSEIKLIHGKFPKYKNSVYVASRLWPIHDERTWRHFFRIATNEYEELHIYVEASVTPPKNLTFHGTPGVEGPSSSRRNNRQTFQNYETPDSGEESDDPDYEQGFWSDVDSATRDNNDETVDPTWANLELEEPYELDYEPERLEVGAIFPSYDALKEAVARENIRQFRQFQSVDKRVRSWKAVCIYPTLCTWHIQAAEGMTSTKWKVKKYQPHHSCREDPVTARDDKILTAKIIASEIAPKVKVDPDYSIKLIMSDIYEKFDIRVSYKKAWNGRLIALERKFGNWEASYNELPMLEAIQFSNPRTVVHLQSQQAGSPDTSEFRRVFWSFKASIDGFRFCLPVVSIDGTHLYGKYKGVLLVAVAMNANREIFALAYAVVESENADSWSWFFARVMRDVVGSHRSVCVISDRHAGIESAFRSLPELRSPQVSKRYCLRHIRSNFMTKFRNAELKKLCWQAGSTPTEQEFHDCMEQIRGINESAFLYLNEIPVEMWALSYDDGKRYGILTTNLSESFNNVLKGCRTLPICALVKATFDKVVQLFADRRNAGIMWHQAGFLYPKNIWKAVLERSQRRYHTTIVPHNRTTGIYSVAISSHDPVTIDLTRQECGCEYWKQNGLPCVHAYAVCRFLKITVDGLILAVYSLNAYIRTYASDIMPINNAYIPVETQHTLLPPTNNRSARVGRPQRT